MREKSFLCALGFGPRHTVRIGQGARRSSFSVTEPSTRCSKPDRPWVPITMRSAGSARASASISRQATPSRRRVVNHDRLVEDRLHELRQLFLGLLVERRVRREQGGHVGHALAGGQDPGDDVKHRDLGSEPAAQGHRLPEGARGEVGEVGGAEDAADVQAIGHGSPPEIGGRRRPAVVASHQPDHVGAAHHPHEAPVLDDGNGVHALA